MNLRTALILGLILNLPSPAGAQVLRDSSHRTTVGAEAEYIAFNGGFDAWKLASASLERRETVGSLIGRINYADRFDTQGAQVEADAYPRLGNAGYAYVNFGYSAASVFPRWRSGAEVFLNLPHAYEASLGYRQLRYAHTTPVTLFTGSVGKYQGNYWFSLRPYVHAQTTGTTASASLVIRRYFEDAYDYVGARVGAGSTPTDRLAPTELQRTSSFAADMHGQNRVAPRTFITWTVGFEQEQLPADVDRRRLDLIAGFKVDF